MTTSREICAICLEPMITPCTLSSCGHCLDCHCLLKVLTREAKQGRRSAPCPICRQPFTLKCLDEKVLYSVHAESDSGKGTLTAGEKLQKISIVVAAGTFYGGLYDGLSGAESRHAIRYA